MCNGYCFCKKIAFVAHNQERENDTNQKIYYQISFLAQSTPVLKAMSPFPTMFSTLSKTEFIIFVTFNLSSANAFNLVWSKILLCGNGLNFSLNQSKYSTDLLFFQPLSCHLQSLIYFTGGVEQYQHAHMSSLIFCFTLCFSVIIFYQ